MQSNSGESRCAHNEVEKKTSDVQIKSKLPVRSSKDTRPDGKSENDAMHKNGTSSNHMPPKDPLLHVPVVTPPCPIKHGHEETPTPLQSYTHVSACKK